MRLAFLQTSDPLIYKEMLDTSAHANLLYCKRHGIGYESYCGIKVGAAPWMATYNRIFMLNELLARGHAGWVLFADADAFVADLDYDVRAYLVDHRDYCLIGASGGSSTPWDINAGVLFINLGDQDGRAFVEDWKRQFDARVPASYLEDPSSAWDDYPNDQTLMYECIKESPDLLRKTMREERRLFNYRDGSFIRQAIRASFPDLRSRTNWIREEVGKVMSEAAMRDRYVDLVELAHKYHSGESERLGKAPSHMQFFQFLFEEFRLEDFEFVHLGFRKAGPEVPLAGNLRADDIAAVRMWLEYFPRAHCHAVDASDSSGVSLDRLRFHSCDIGVPLERARLREYLPALRLVFDRAGKGSFRQQAAFAALFSLLEPGGYYVIEGFNFQPDGPEPDPPCRPTCDVFLGFPGLRALDIPFLSPPDRMILGSQIGHIHVVRRREDGFTTMIAIQKVR